MKNRIEPVRVGVVGCGYWGPNLVRNFSLLEEFRVAAACDVDPSRLEYVRRQFAIDKLTTSAREVLEDPSIEAVAIATPVSTHAALVREALENGKHVLVEKPFAQSAAECRELAALAASKGRTLLVDHTFVFTGAVERMRKLITDGDLGRLYYFDSVRVNLGLFQHDCNVLWDLAPHDLSIMLHLIDERPSQIIAVGAAPVDPGAKGLESIAYLTVRFRSGLIGHIHVNWLAPVKIRMMLLGGSRKMVTWDDVEPDTKLRVYDRGIEDEPSVETIYRALVQYRTGDMYSPKIEKVEALRKECAHFYRCIREDERPRSGGELGTQVVALLEAAEESLHDGGRAVNLPESVFDGVPA